MGLVTTIAVSVAGLTTGYLIFPGNYKKFDRNILRPIRNYRSNMQDWNRFQLQEEFTEFLGDLGTGVKNTFTGN